MTVESGDTVPMVDNHSITVATIPTRKNHSTALCCPDDTAIASTKIKPRMEADVTENWMPSPAKTAGNRSITGVNEFTIAQTTQVGQVGFGVGRNLSAN